MEGEVKKVFTVILAIVLLALVFPASGVSAKEEVIWHRSDTGMDGGAINTLAMDPQTPATLYAGTWGGGVFKSLDGGASWSAVNSGLTATDVLTLAIDPQTPATL